MIQVKAVMIRAQGVDADINHLHVDVGVIYRAVLFG
jgi:hypothetical protein